MQIAVNAASAGAGRAAITHPPALFDKPIPLLKTLFVRWRTALPNITIYTYSNLNESRLLLGVGQKVLSPEKLPSYLTH